MLSATTASQSSCAVPIKSELPHDLSHYVVEAELRLDQGFWVHRKGGAFPGSDRGLGKAAVWCEPKISRGDPRDALGSRASEFLVEALRVAARIRDPALRFAKLVSPELPQWFPVPADKHTRRQIVERLLILESRWQELSVGESITLFWPLRGARTRHPSERSASRLRWARTLSRCELQPRCAGQATVEKPPPKLPGSSW